MSTQKLRTPIAAILSLLHTILDIVSFIAMSPIGLASNPLIMLSIPLDIFLCIILFKKKKDNILIFAIAAYALKSLISFVVHITNLNINVLFNAVAYCLVLLLAIAFSDQSLIKIDLSKVKKHYKMLNRIALILFLVAPFMSTIYWSDIILLFSTAIGVLIFSLLHIFTFISLVNWLINPYKDVDYGDAYCSMAKHIFLSIFTCGIWPLIWIYRITTYLNKAPNSEYYNPTSKLLLCIFVPFYQIFWFYKHGQRIDSICQSKNRNSNMATLCLVLAIFIPFVATIIMQDTVNQLSMMESQEQKLYEVGQEIVSP